MVEEPLTREYGSLPENIVVGLSPALQKQSACYPDLTQEDDRRWQPYISKSEHGLCVNTVGFACDQLLKSGIDARNIEQSGVDTKTSPDFFSHRRSQETGEPEARFGCLIGINQER